MTATLYDRLQHKLAEAFAESWQHTQPGKFELEPSSGMRADGSLAAGVSFLVQKRNGTWVEVHREPMTTMANESAVDDFVARGLSVYLMKHPSWPT